MTPLFWIALIWVLASIMVERLPLRQRFIPGGMLILAAVPILLSLVFQVGWFMALLGAVTVVSLYPNVQHLLMACYRGDEVRFDANTLRYLVVPGEI